MPSKPLLVCVPPAGGGKASFRGWQRLLGESLTLHVMRLPRHEDGTGAIREAARELAREVADEVGTAPFALFGHSMGALLAYEAAACLQRDNGPSPVHLFVSAAPAPPAAAEKLARVLADNDPIELLRRLGGIPPELLRTPSLTDLAASIIRADCSLLAGYRPCGTVLTCPVTVLAGRDDPMTDAAGLARWRDHTSARCRVVEFPGSHFYYRDQLGEVLRLIAEQVPAGTARR